MSPKRDLRKELIADLEQIEDNARLYRAGRESAYQAVAIQLRNILLRGRRALLSQVVPEPTLHQLRPSNIPPSDLDAFRRNPANSDILDVRGVLSLITAPPGAQVRLEFVNELLPLGQWLNQWIIRPDVTIGQLIEQVTDEEVAHTQDSFGKTVALASHWVFGGVARQRVLRHMAIVALGEYVAKRVGELIGDLGS